MLSTFDTYGDGLADVPLAARRAEELGFDSLWVGDHLSFYIPILDSTVCLAAAAAVTSRISLGWAVMLLALRDPAWAAKQVGTLQRVSRDRVVLGIGVGGENPPEWEAAGVPLKERGRRTDAVLQALPELLGGRETYLGAPYSRTIAALEPAAPVPPVWVGGGSDAALRRAVRFGDAWIGAFADAASIARRRSLLEELAGEAGRPVPAVATVVLVHVGDDPDRGERESQEFFERQYRTPWEKGQRYAVRGTIDEVVDRLQGLVDAGVEHFVVSVVGRDPLAFYEPLAEVRERLQACPTRPGGA